MAEILAPTILNEHEGVTKDPAKTQGPNAYNPTEDEKKIILKVNKLFDKSKKARKKYDSKWVDWYNFFRGKQWKEDRPSYRHSAVINLVFRAIQSNVPIQTDARPKFEFLPTEPSDQELALILNEVAQSDWETKNWLMQLAEIVLDANIYGTGLGEVCFNEKENQGLGDIGFESCDPFYSFPDPDCCDINHDDSSFFIYAEPTDVEKLKQKYPDKKDFIKADLKDFKGQERGDIYKTTDQTPTQSLLAQSSDAESGSENNKDKCLVITCWLKDDEIIEEPNDVPNDDGSMGQEIIQKKKYPNGRKIVIASNVLLEDIENPYDDGKIPFAKMQNYMLPREFWGISEIENLEGPQKYYNKIVSFALDVLHLMGNPIWIVSSDSGIDTDNLFNRPGMVLEPAPNSRVDRVEGVHLQPYVFQLLNLIKADFNEVAGSEDISRGVKPEGVTAAKAIEALQDTAQTRLRGKARFLDAFLQQMGQMYLSRIMQFRTGPQVYRITNDQNAQKYFKFSVEDRPKMQPGLMDPMTGMSGPEQPSIGPDGQPEMQKVAMYTEMGTDEMGNQIQADPKEFEIRGKFDVRVGTGSSLPFAKTEKVTNAYQLFDRGIIDAEEVMKVVDWPNYQAVQARMQQKALEAQQAQMQAQAMGMDPAAQGAPVGAPQGM